MAYLVLLAAIFLAVVLGGGTVVFLLLRRRSPVAAALAAVLTVAVMTACFPIPTHGGFTFLFEVALHELSQTGDAVAVLRDEAADERFWQRQSERFARPLEVVATHAAGGSWREVTVAGGGRAWLDSATGLLWSDLLELRTESSLPPLDAARALCGALEPPGAWALPSEGDQYSFWRAEGHLRLPGRSASQVSYLVDADLRLEMPVYQLGGGGNQPDGSPARTFAIRCLARTDQAPAHGWARADIPLEEWNAFQLGKLTASR